MGAAFGNPHPSRVDGAPLSDAEPVIVGRIGVTPQTLVAQQNRRVVDFSLGYAFHVFTDDLRQNRNRHGFFGGMSVLLGDWFVPDAWRVRIIVHGSGEYFVQQAHPGDGGGASWAIGFEIARYTQHESTEPSAGLWGFAAGELALGAEAFGSVHSIGGYEYGTIGFALTGRWPGVLGVFLIPLSGSF